MQTLFGLIESKSETRERAKKLYDLYCSLADAPGALECRQGQVEQIQSFIDRSKARGYDANWWDGLLRAIGDPEDLLSDRDVAAMRRDKSYWKVNRTYHYLNCPPDSTFRCKLHPKEIAYLEKLKTEVQGEIDNIEINVPLIRDEAESLRQIGPFPKEVAERYRLTVDGYPQKKAA